MGVGDATQAKRGAGGIIPEDADRGSDAVSGGSGEMTWPAESEDRCL